jgi:hypothetical protein
LKRAEFASFFKGIRNDHDCCGETVTVYNDDFFDKFSSSMVDREEVFSFDKLEREWGKVGPLCSSLKTTDF